MYLPDFSATNFFSIPESTMNNENEKLLQLDRPNLIQLSQIALFPQFNPASIE
jgi:hypothetical protein